MIFFKSSSYDIVDMKPIFIGVVKRVGAPPFMKQQDNNNDGAKFVLSFANGA